MAFSPVSAITNNSKANIDLSQASSLNNSQISALLTKGNVDPNFAVMLLNQMTTNNINSILFSEEKEGSDYGYLGSDIFGASSDNSDPLLSTFGISSTTNPMSNLTGTVPTQFEMSIYSTLIGKTVTAVSSSNQQISGTVKSVQLQNSKVMLDVNGTIVPAENLIKIQ